MAKEDRVLDFGAFYFPTHYGIEVADLAWEMESRGFESLFLCEHTHIPVSRRTPVRLLLPNRHLDKMDGQSCF